MIKNQTIMTKILSDGPSIENIVSYWYKRYDSDEHNVFNYHCLSCDIVCSNADELHLNVCKRKSYKPTDTKIIKCGPCNKTVDGLNHWMDYHEQTAVHREKYRTNRGRLYWYYCRVCKIAIYDTEYSIKVHILQGTLGKVVTPMLCNRLSSLPSIMRCMAYVYKTHVATRSVAFTGAIQYCEVCDTYEVTPRPIYLAELHNAHTNIVRLGKRLYYKFYCDSCRVTFICEKSTYKSHLSSVEHAVLLRMVTQQTYQKSIKSWNVPKIIIFNFEGLLTTKCQEMIVTVCKSCGDTLKLTAYDDLAILKHVFESCSKKLTTIILQELDVSIDIKVWCGLCSMSLFGIANWTQHVLSASHIMNCRIKTFEFYKYYMCTKCIKCFQLYFGMAEDMPFKNHEYQLLGFNNLMRYIYNEVNKVITNDKTINLTFFFCQKTGNFGRCNRSTEPESVPNYCQTCRLEFYGDSNIFHYHTFTVEHLLLQCFTPVISNKSITNVGKGQLTSTISEKDKTLCHSWSIGLISQLKVSKTVNKVSRSNENKIIKDTDNKVNVGFANIPASNLGDIMMANIDSENKAFENSADNNDLWSMSFMNHLNVDKATIDLEIVTTVARSKENKVTKGKKNKTIEDEDYKIVGDDMINKNTDNTVDDTKDKIAKVSNNVEIMISSNKVLGSTQTMSFKNCFNVRNTILNTVKTVTRGNKNKVVTEEENKTIKPKDYIMSGVMDNMIVKNMDNIVVKSARNEKTKVPNNVEIIISDNKALWSTQSMSFMDHFNVSKAVVSAVSTAASDKENKVADGKENMTIDSRDYIAVGNMDVMAIKNTDNIVVEGTKNEVAKMLDNEKVIISDNKALWFKSMSYMDRLFLPTRKVILQPAPTTSTNQKFKMLNKKQNKTIEGADNKEVGGKDKTKVGKIIVHDIGSGVVKDVDNMKVTMSTDNKTISWSTRFINLKNYLIARKVVNAVKYKGAIANENGVTKRKENKTIEDTNDKTNVSFSNVVIGDMNDINNEYTEDDSENETLVNSTNDNEFKCADNDDLWFTWFVNCMDQLNIRKPIVSTINAVVRDNKNKVDKRKNNIMNENGDYMAVGGMDKISVKNTDNVVVEGTKTEVAKVSNKKKVIILNNNALMSTKSISFMDRLFLTVRKVAFNPANTTATSQEFKMLEIKENETIEGTDNKEFGDMDKTTVGKIIVHDTHNDIVKNMGNMEVKISTNSKTILWSTQFINFKNRFIARKEVNAVKKKGEVNKNKIVEQKENKISKNTESKMIKDSDKFVVEETENFVVIRGANSDVVKVANDTGVINAVNIEIKGKNNKTIGGSEDNVAECEINNVVEGTNSIVEKSVVLRKINDTNLKAKSIANNIVENVTNKVVKCFETNVNNEADITTVFLEIGSKNYMRDMNSNVVECEDNESKNKVIKGNKNIMHKEVVVGVDIIGIDSKEYKMVDDVNTNTIVRVENNEVKSVNESKIGIQSVLDLFLNLILILFLYCSEFFERYSITE